jgi:PKD repeat protein
MLKKIRLILRITFIALLFTSCSKDTPAAIPTANFSWTPASNTAPANVSFVNNSTNTSSYLWDFGDGSTSTLPNPSHIFTVGGVYLVKLNATGAGGVAMSSNNISILAPTELKITVLDATTNIVSGAIVKLYTNATDLQNQTNQVNQSLTTNTNGFVVFTNLQPIKYYWYISKSCQNNYNTTVTTTNNLTANTQTIVNSQITSTGNLVFNNNSTNPYKVEVNGVVLYSSMAGGTSNTYNSAPIGSYTIKVTQLSGYVFTPTINTYNGVLTCGSSLTVTFP